VAAFAEATRWIGGALQRDSDSAMAAAAPYLRLFGLAAGGVYLAKGALATTRNGTGGGQGHGKADVAQPIAIARFFAETLATAAPGLKDTIVDGAAATLMLAPDAL
jgi:acyl-CoA dehydrogenase